MAYEMAYEMDLSMDKKLQGMLGRMCQGLRGCCNTMKDAIFL